MATASGSPFDYPSSQSQLQQQLTNYDQHSQPPTATASTFNPGPIASIPLRTLRGSVQQQQQQPQSAVPVMSAFFPSHSSEEQSQAQPGSDGLLPGERVYDDPALQMAAIGTGIGQDWGRTDPGWNGQLDRQHNQQLGWNGYAQQQQPQTGSEWEYNQRKLRRLHPWPLGV